MISFVGAGPGAADLLTLRGADRLQRADIIIWASSLVPETILDHAHPEADVLDSAGMTLEDACRVYEANPTARIVRLHSGDPSLYGAIAEQIAWCTTHGRDFEIVPGVSSMGAAAAVLGAELTLPGTSQSVVVTRLAHRTAASLGSGEDVEALCAHGATMALFLSAARPAPLQRTLLSPGSAYRRETPAAIVVRATWPDERVIWTTVGNLAKDLKRCGATTTVLVIVGEVLRSQSPGCYPSHNTPPGDSTASHHDVIELASSTGGSAAGRGRSHLYAPDFAHAHRKRSDPGSTEGRPAGTKRS